MHEATTSFGESSPPEHAKAASTRALGQRPLASISQATHHQTPVPLRRDLCGGTGGSGAEAGLELGSLAGKDEAEARRGKEGACVRRKGRCAVLPRLVLDASARLHCAAQASAWKERVASKQVQSRQLPVQGGGGGFCRQR